ncbi:outer membrane protein assembly factor BamA [Salinarimonas soli]|uniref:Outer membrane protein assembly factor BamA n=1 Tax=Salinarimonas soli TaxID=1638099 RepID=A0A5B2VDJ2_9HYPH|nr:outer membrane protein assembly factor BamA [Salinarimonas soli]KAA2237014.1 outer membrane protein assembly factor BamA [Salinarimonas soli]
MMSTTMKRGRGTAKSATIAALAMVATLSAGSALAQQVVIEGNRRVDAETIRSYVSGSSTEEARRNLLATGMFSDVRVSRRGGATVVSVRENNLINRVVFEGNRRVPREVLEPEVTARARGPFTEAMLQADADRIREIYRRSGRALANVTPRVVDLPNGRVDIVYTIEEGGKTPIQAINFVGNQSYSASRLRGVMTSAETNLLSFIKTNDVYDPDRLASDLELIRRYYLKNGYADFRVVSSDVQFDQAQGGYVITIAVEEGPQYRVGEVSVDSRLGPEVDPAVLRSRVTTSSGAVYNAEAVERSLTNVTTEIARRGYAFAQVRPVGQRDPATRTISVAYVVEEGPRVYIERINVRGNTRTRDYVIRRELDLGEGDAYNKVLVDRAERRLNNTGFFKRVRVTNEPGSSPDRVVVNIDVEDQPTGAFSIAGGYSTADGFIGEVSVTESNFLGRGQFVRLAGTAGQKSQGVDFSFTEPYFLGYRLAAGFDLFTKFSDQTQYSRYENRTTGGAIRFALPITEEISVGIRYSLFQQEVKIPNSESKPYNDCSFPIPGVTSLLPGGIPSRLTTATPTGSSGCEANGEASIAIKEAQGRTLTSLVGLNFVYNSLDNFRNPTSGFYGEIKPEVAGLGGDSRYFRLSGEGRAYYEIFEEIVGIARVQGGHIAAFGGDNLRVIDHYFLGPSLVRGFAPSGLGPRDVGTVDARSNAIGGTTYFGGSLEVQFPIFGLPRDLGLKGAVFADAGTLFGYKGNTAFDVNRNGIIDGVIGGVCTANAASPTQQECLNVRDNKTIRSSVGASLLWASPLGPIRFDYAVALSKDEGVVLPNGSRVGGDRTQAFRFSGGTRF